MTNKPYLGDVLDHYGVVFKPDKNRQKLHCPAHDDSVASCSIVLDEGLYNCHACGSSGDSYSLIMAKEGVEFAAAKRIAEGISTDGSHNLPGAVDGHSQGLLGSTRNDRRHDSKVRFRPVFKSLGGS